MKKFKLTNDDMAAFHGALDRLDADELRHLIREFHQNWKYLESGPNFFRDSIVHGAAKKDPQWDLPAIDDAETDAAIRFVGSIRSGGQVQPEDLDQLLKFASALLLRGSHELAFLVLSSIMTGLHDVTFEVLGFDECPTEVLAYDMDRATTEYGIATYFCLPAESRARAIYRLLAGSNFLYYSHKPLAAMAAVSVRSLPQWEEFLMAWRELLQAEVDSLEHGLEKSISRGWLDEVIAFD